jgi:hypothetical protein
MMPMTGVQAKAAIKALGIKSKFRVRALRTSMSNTLKVEIVEPSLSRTWTSDIARLVRGYEDLIAAGVLRFWSDYLADLAKEARAEKRRGGE